MKLHTVLFAFALAGCTNGKGEVDVTAANVATFPGAPAAAGEPMGDAAAQTTDGYITLDVHKDLDSMSQLGTLSGVIETNTLSGPDLAFIQHITASIAAEDGTMPVELVSDVDVPRNGTVVELSMSMSDSRVLEYLTEGKVTIHFYITGHIPQRPLTLTHTMIAHMSIAVKSSVLKL